MPDFNDVNLNLTVVLGKGSLSLGILDKMKKDSIIPLETEIIEPVKVMVNGVVKFEGVVVTLGNKFGVKITNEC